MKASKPTHLESTGERMIPEKSVSSVFWKHIYRYSFATSYVRGKRVLDIACGEGYGTAILRDAGASSVIGVDISQLACQHARDRYKIDARVGDAENIPIPNDSIDVIVSFETIEHVLNPGKFIDECIRVLTSHGTLIISTPNKPVYSAKGKHNQFHHIEFDEDEFTSIVGSRFKEFEIYEQCSEYAPALNPAMRSVQKITRRVPGSRRINRLLRKMFCPHLRRKREQYYRDHPMEATKIKHTGSSYYIDPYLIRKRSGVTNENATNFVAVASEIA